MPWTWDTPWFFLSAIGSGLLLAIVGVAIEMIWWARRG